jgi:phage gp36-like protein
MGSYATTTTISLRLPGLLNGETTTADADFSSVFSSFTDKAEAYFNAVASKHYTIPFATVPPIAREMSFDMAAYWTILAFSTRDWPNRNEMLDDYKQVFDMLKMLGNGDLKLALTDGSLIAQTTGLIVSNREGQDSVFDVDEPTAWAVDQDRLDTLADSRE